MYYIRPVNGQITTETETKTGTHSEHNNSDQI